MTREEEIIEAGIEYTMRNNPCCIGGDNFYEQVRKFNRNKSFEAGAEWADANPKPLWISVKDDLPCNHEDMIFEINPLDKSTNCVLVRFSYGGVSIESMHCRGYKQEWCWSADNITHWMIIPELLKG